MEIRSQTFHVLFHVMKCTNVHIEVREGNLNTGCIFFFIFLIRKLMASSCDMITCISYSSIFFFRQIIIVCDYHIYWWKFHISFNFLIQQYFQESTSCFSDVVHIKGEVKLKSSTKSTLINQKWKANVGSLSVAVSIHVFFLHF